MTSFGIDVPAAPRGDPRGFYVEVGSVARQAGFQRLWMGDHLVWNRPRYETFTLLAALAAWSDLSIGTGILLAPLRRPLWIAKMAATLDQLTRGRFVLGLGAGGEMADEFELLGVPRNERGRLTDEAIDICRASWAGELHPGFSPLPMRTIPIWIGGRSEAALHRAGRLGDGYLGLFSDPQRFERTLRTIGEHREAAGRPGRTAGAIALWCAVDDQDPVRALRRAGDAIAGEYRLPRERFERYLVAGSAAGVAERIEAFVAAGAVHIDVHIAHPDFRAQVERFGEQVLPRLRGAAEVV